MSQEIPDTLLVELIAKVVKIQKKYAHELSGVRNNRRAEIKESTEAPRTRDIAKFVGEKCESSLLITALTRGLVHTGWHAAVLFFMRGKRAGAISLVKPGPDKLKMSVRK